MTTRNKSIKEAPTSNLNSAVNSIEEGSQLLLQDRMIIEDMTMDKQAIATMLLYIAQESAKTPRSVVDHIRAVAFLLIDDNSMATAQTITSKTLDIREELIEKLTESTRGWTQITEKVVQLQKEQEKVNADTIVKCNKSFKQI